MTVVRRIALLPAVPVLLVAAWWTATAGSTNFFWPPLSEIAGAFREWSGIILLGLIGIALSAVFRLVAARLLSWYTGVRAARRDS